MRSLPPSVWAGHLFPDRELPESNDRLRVDLLRCLGYVAQLYYFSRKGYIPKSIWRRNERTYALMLRGPIFLREWKNLAPMFDTDHAFCRYVEQAQAGSNGDNGLDQF
jgi:hypothetical protein